MIVRGWRSTKEVCAMIGGILSANGVSSWLLGWGDINLSFFVKNARSSILFEDLVEGEGKFFFKSIVCRKKVERSIVFFFYECRWRPQLKQNPLIKM